MVTWGCRGDVQPFVDLGCHLQRSFHAEVTVLASRDPCLRRLIEAAGLAWADNGAVYGKEAATNAHIRGDLDDERTNAIAFRSMCRRPANMESRIHVAVLSTYLKWMSKMYYKHGRTGAEAKEYGGAPEPPWLIEKILRDQQRAILASLIGVQPDVILAGTLRNTAEALAVAQRLDKPIIVVSLTSPQLYADAGPWIPVRAIASRHGAEKLDVYRSIVRAVRLLIPSPTLIPAEERRLRQAELAVARGTELAPEEERLIDQLSFLPLRKWEICLSHGGIYKREQLRFRGELHLPFTGATNTVSLIEDHSIPYAICIDRALFPGCEGVPPNIRTVGFMDGLNEADTGLPVAVRGFLEGMPDRPTICVTFGSMSIGKSGQLSRLLAALERVAAQMGVRFLFIPGWSAMSDITCGPLRDVHVAAADEEVCFRDLFPRCAGVIHHGGAGTAHTAMRAGVPQAVFPVLGDQAWFGQRVFESGIGPRAYPRNVLLNASSRSMAAVIRRTVAALLDTDTRARAMRFGASLRAQTPRSVERMSALISRVLAEETPWRKG
jgi:hypothetical protein